MKCREKLRCVDLKFLHAHGFLHKVLIVLTATQQLLWKERSACVTIQMNAICYVVQGCSNFWACGWNPKVWPFKWKLQHNKQHRRKVLTFESFESVDEILKCDHSNESYWAVLSCGAVYYAVQALYSIINNSVGKYLLLSLLSLWMKS